MSLVFNSRATALPAVPGLAPLGDLNLLKASLLVLLVAAIMPAQRVVVRDADPLSMPGQVDSNSPAFWVGGEMRLINSLGGSTRISRGPDQYQLGDSRSVSIARNNDWPAWIEAVWVDPSGTILAWYHQEEEWLCGSHRPALPRIGAAFSYDGGRTFFDAGIILQSGVRQDCSHRNGYFAGGHGDFSVVLDREQKYFYFLFGNYGGPVENQGVAAARMRFEDRFHPVGAVWKYRNGEWNQPGVGGVMSPFFPARVSWAAADTDSFWGPSVHWNTHLNMWVMLLNRSCCDTGWPQEGIYISFNYDIANPEGWSAPLKILDDTGWYPQIIGMGEGESDSLSGRIARLYIYGHSYYEIVFLRDGEADPSTEMPPLPTPEVAPEPTPEPAPEPEAPPEPPTIPAPEPPPAPNPEAEPDPEAPPEPPTIPAPELPPAPNPEAEPDPEAPPEPPTIPAPEPPPAPNPEAEPDPEAPSEPTTVPQPDPAPESQPPSDEETSEPDASVSVTERARPTLGTAHAPRGGAELLARGPAFEQVLAG